MNNKKQKLKINKWKITAIISLILNGLVALLLTIGLAKPRTYVKASALNDNEYYLYSLRSDYQTYFTNTLIHSGELYENLYELRSSHPSDFYDYYQQDLLYYFEFRLSANETLVTSQNYDFTNYISNSRVRFIFQRWMDSTHTTWRQRLYNVIFFNEDTIWPYNIDWYEYGFTTTSSYIQLHSDNYSLKYALDYLYSYQGTSAPYKDYFIRDGWNPNKYISIASDSIGLLYDSPSSSSWLPNPQVKWVSPTYYHDYSLPSGRVQKVSTLGFLEIPLIFESNGEMFNGIRIYYDVYHHYIDKDGNVQHTSPETSAVGGVTTNYYHYGFVYMSYTYTLSSGLGAPLTTWKEKVVSAVPVYQITQDIFTDSIEYREFIYEPFEPYKWLNDEYKVIHTFDYSKPSLNRVGVNENVSRSRFAINQLTIEQVLEYDMSVSASPVGSNTYLGDAFSLIRDAFASILPILSLSILPNITIGMLIFIPLVLTIIIVVIKLVKR